MEARTLDYPIGNLNPS